MGYLAGLAIVAVACVMCVAETQENTTLSSPATSVSSSTTPLASSTTPSDSSTPLPSSTTPSASSTTPLASASTSLPSSTTPVSSAEGSQLNNTLEDTRNVCSNCGKNSKCDWKPALNESQCSCLDGYEGPPPKCRPGPKLWEVCYEGNPCGSDSECEMDKDGKRFCRCMEGYFGCPPNCEAGPRRLARCQDCGPNSECDDSTNATCHCLPGFVGDPPNCTAGKELLKICDPYPCGGNAGCEQRNGLSWCYCLPGYVGAAPNCKPGPEMWRLCVQDRPCGLHSKCEVNDGAAVCSQCSSGYSGSPPDCVKDKKEKDEPQKQDDNTTKI